MDATQAAAEALTNGASANGAAPTAKQVATAVQRFTTAAAETGFGFIGLSVAAVSTKYSLDRFAAAWRAVK